MSRHLLLTPFYIFIGMRTALFPLGRSGNPAV